MELRSVKHLSGSIESYLDSLFSDSIEKIPSKPEVTPGLEQSECDVLCRPNTSWESFSEKTAFFDELRDGIGDLQEEIEDLAGCLIVAVDVLQLKSPVLLDIETLVFYFPSDSSSIICHLDGCCPTDPEICDPLEPSGCNLTVSIRFGLKTLKNSKGVLPVFRIYVGYLVYPPILLIDPGSFSSMVFQVVLGMEPKESSELLLDRGEVVLVDDKVLPTVPVAQIKYRTDCKEAVETEAYGKAGKSFLHLFRQPVESFKLAVLFCGILTRIFNELRHKGEGKSVGGHNLCLQHLVVVDGFLSMNLSEAVGAVSFIECDGAGSIDGHNIVDVKKSRGVEHFLSDKGLGCCGNSFLPLIGTQFGVKIIESVSMGKGFHIEKNPELLAGWFVFTKYFSDLPSSAESEQKHENPCKAKGCKAVGGLFRLSWISKTFEDSLDTAEPVIHGAQKNAHKLLLLFCVYVGSQLLGLRSGEEIFFHCGLLGSADVRNEREKSEFSHDREDLSSPYFMPICCAKKDRSSLLKGMPQNLF